MRRSSVREAVLAGTILVTIAPASAAGQDLGLAPGTRVRLRLAGEKRPVLGVVLPDTTAQVLVRVEDGRPLSAADVLAIESWRRDTGAGVAAGTFSGAALYGAAALTTGAGAASAATALALNSASGECCCGLEAAAWGAGAGALSGAVAGAVARERWRPHVRRRVRLSLGRPPRGKGIAARVTIVF